MAAGAEKERRHTPDPEVVEALVRAYETRGWFKPREIPTLRKIFPYVDEICDKLKLALRGNMRATYKWYFEETRKIIDDATLVLLWDTLAVQLSDCVHIAATGTLSSATREAGIRAKMRPLRHAQYAIARGTLDPSLRGDNIFVYLCQLDALGVANVEFEQIDGRDQIVTYHPVQLGEPRLAKRVHGAKDILGTVSWEEVFPNPYYAGIGKSEEGEADIA